jgi:hypothetical protein
MARTFVVMGFREWACILSREMEFFWPQKNLNECETYECNLQSSPNKGGRSGSFWRAGDRTYSTISTITPSGT